MIFQKVAIVVALTAAAAAQDIPQSSIPSQCTAICAEVVTISAQCDKRFKKDNAELQCMCTATNAEILFPACEACVAKFDTEVDVNDGDPPNDNDVYDVLTRCSFTITTYNSASAASLASSIGSSASASSVILSIDFSASSAASASRSASGAVVTSTSSGVVVARSTSSGAAVTTSAAPTTTAAQGAGNVAPAPTAAAVMGIGALGFALGML